MNESTARKTPLHLWIVGVLAILWDSVGVWDFIMTQTKSLSAETYSQEQIDYFYGIPMWAVVFWAIAVFGGLIGSVLLLLRKKLAVTVFAASMVGFFATATYNYVLSNGYEIMGGVGPVIFTGVIFLVGLFLLIYSMAMQKAGVLT